MENGRAPAQRVGAIFHFPFSILAGVMVSSLVIQTSFLGDTVLTTPLIAELARRGPVDVVTTPASAGLLANHPAIRAVISYDKRGTDRGVRGFLRLASQVRRFGYEAAYLAQ